MDTSLFDDPEALIALFVNERTEEWFNAGATLENATAALRSSVSMADYAAEIAAKYDQVFIDALLTEGWESDPDLAKWVNERMVPVHASTLALYFLTAFPDINPLDKEPYRRSIEFERVISAELQADGSLRIVNLEVEEDNEEMNRVGEKLTDGKKVIGDGARPTREFVIENGSVRISGIVLADAGPAE